MRIAASQQALPLAREGAAAERVSILEQEVTGLFDQLRAPVLRYTLHFGLTMEDGEEITQEVFLSLFRHLQQDKPRDNLRAWIFRVAHNLALKRRTSPGYPGVGHAGLNSPASDAPGDRDLLADPAPSPEEQAAANQAQQRLLAVFRVLPEQDRHCLMLRAEGLRYREIGQALGMSLGAVSISLSRSLARLGRAAER